MIAQISCWNCHRSYRENPKEDHHTSALSVRNGLLPARSAASTTSTVVRPAAVLPRPAPIGIERFQDIKIGDVIEAFKVEKLEPVLA